MIQAMHDLIVCLSLRPVGVDLLRHSPMPHDVPGVAARLRAVHILKLRLREYVAPECNCQRRGANQTQHVGTPDKHGALLPHLHPFLLKYRFIN